ncbi:hypothetical protein ScPMuIL_018443 [Solemya velum]
MEDEKEHNFDKHDDVVKGRSDSENDISDNAAAGHAIAGTQIFEEENDAEGANAEERKSGPTDHEDLQKLQLDLADPETLIHMLNNVNLTEDDTEELLQEAYNVNRKLKEILRRQEVGGSANASRSEISELLGTHPGLKRNHTILNQSSVLPPIGPARLPTSIYDIKRTRSTLSRSSVASTSAPNKKTASKSTSHIPTKSRSSSSKASHKDKPAWDDRFSFS